jgi:hypothetical protein
MGVWGPENFANDTAFCFALDAVVKPLTTYLYRLAENPALADAENDTSYKIMAAVEILALVCKELRLAPPPLELVKSCRELCLQGWDEGIERLDPNGNLKEPRRAVIAETFERLIEVCKFWESL